MRTALLLCVLGAAVSCARTDRSAEHTDAAASSAPTPVATPSATPTPPEPAETGSTEPAKPTATAKRPTVAPPAPSPTPIAPPREPMPEAAAKAPASNACVDKCIAARQMQAISPEQIAAKCRAECGVK